MVKPLMDLSNYACVGLFVTSQDPVEADCAVRLHPAVSEGVAKHRA